MSAPAHRIASIAITHHRLDYAPPFHASWDTKPRVYFDATIVRVTTDTGLVGLDPAHDELVSALALGCHAGKGSVV